MQKRNLYGLVKRVSAILILISILPVNASKNETTPSDAMYQNLSYIQEQFSDRQVGTQANRVAAQWLVKELESVGYTVKEESFEQNGYTFYNYFVMKPGQSKKTLYVGAHYDSVNTYGIDDNGSGLCVVLELAKRFYSMSTPYTIQFCFFDGEESFKTKLGYAGSCNFCNTHIERKKDAVAYINIDSIAAGDELFVYGGAWESGGLTRTGMYQWARRVAFQNGIDLKCLPEEVSNPNASEAVTGFRSPARETGSDHHYFNSVWKIPYIYIEANRWCEEDGSGGNEKTNQTCHYQTNEEQLENTGGQVMHTEWDNLDKIEALFPGRVKQHMEDVYTVVSNLLKINFKD